MICSFAVQVMRIGIHEMNHMINELTLSGAGRAGNTNVRISGSFLNRESGPG